MSAAVLAATSPVVRGVRMLVAPVDRVSGRPAAFDPAAQGRFAGVPAGWFDLGAVTDVAREAETVFTEVGSGAPAMVKTRARSKVSAGLRCTFGGWSRLAMALSGGSQVMNLLRRGPGGDVEPAATLLAGSSATVLQVPAGTSIAAGDIVVADEDYTGETGYVGAAIPGDYVASAGAVANDGNYVRRVSFNVARVVRVSTAGPALTVTLAAPLIAGVPASTMKLSVVQGFADRVGGSFLQEWSALLAWDGVQGDRVLVHYPRLQVASGNAEAVSDLAQGLQRLLLRAHFHALPAIDLNNGDAVLCSRSYLPAPGRAV